MVGSVESGMLTGKFKCHISTGKVKLPYGFPYFFNKSTGARSKEISEVSFLVRPGA